MKVLAFLFLILIGASTDARIRQRALQNASAFDIAPLQEGGFIVTGGLNSGTNKTCYLMKFDSLGNPVWLSSYTNSVEFYSYGKCVIPLPGNGYLFAGVMFHDTISNEEITLAKCDPAGTILWSKEYGNPFDDDEAGNMILVNNGILIAGHCTNYGQGGEDFFLIKTDSSGNLQWTKTFGSALNERGIDLVHHPLGFILGGYGLESSGTKNDILLLVLDSSTNMVNTIRISLPGNQELKDIDIDNNGNILIAATTETNGNSPHALLLKISSQWNLIWSKTLQTDFSIPYKITHTDNGFVVAGETYLHVNEENAFVMEMDSNCTILSENYFGDSTGTSFQTFYTMTDSIQLAGKFKRPNDSQSSLYLNKFATHDTVCNYFTRNSTLYDVAPTLIFENWQSLIHTGVETNSVINGTLTSWSDTTICDYNSSVYEIDFEKATSIAPNPAGENAIVFLPFENRETMISIINDEGKLIRNVFTKEKSPILLTGDLIPGVYSIRIQCRGISFSKRLLIQR
jgi:hypothetical protein